MSSAWKKLLNNKHVTQLPHYAINKSLPADSYFTTIDTARKCYDYVLNMIDISDHTLIEPSAGEGAFYDLFPSDRRIGIELHSRRPEFIHHDYLTWYPNEEKKYIAVGNPPFGVRGAYALAFLNRSLLFCDYVAFILPMSFHSNGKGSNMKRVHNAHLIFSKVLEKEGFSSPDNGKTIQVNTLFQIWKRGPGQMSFPSYDVSKYASIYTVCSSPNRLCGLDKINQYDFLVSSSFFGNSLKSVFKFDDVNYGSGYGIILHDKKKEILSKIKSVDWNQYCSLATNSCKHIRKHSIEQCLYDLGYGEEKKINTILDHINE